MHKTSEIEILVNGNAYRCSVNGACSGNVPFCATVPKAGGMTRVDTFENKFSADAVCAAAMLYADRNRISANTVVVVECAPGSDVIPVVVNPMRQQATCVLPVPEVVELSSDAATIHFKGTVCFVHLSDAAFPPSDDVGADLFVSFRGDGAEASIWRRGGDHSWEPVDADGLAAAAIAITAAKGLSDGVTEHDVCMKSGTAEVGVSMRGGRLCGLSVCSTVAIRSKGE